MELNTRILVCDDNPSIHADFRKVLNPGNPVVEQEIADLEVGLFGDGNEVPKADAAVRYEIDSAYQGQQALAMVAEAHAADRPYALVYMDVRMPPGWDGIETIARIWEKFPHVEVVICTAYSDYAWEDIVARLGTTDKLLFVTKPFDAIVVKQMTHSLIKKWNFGEQARHYVMNLETEIALRTGQLKTILQELESKNESLARANERLTHIALHDPLTALANRSLFNDRMDHAVKMARRDNSGFAVFMMDLDRFKEINDVHGHGVGDEVLKETAARLAQALRDSDTVARLGGDEFASILRGVEKHTAMQVAERVVRCLEPPVQVNGKFLPVAASVGVALYPAHGTDADTVLRNADSAMYAAKVGGKGAHCFDPSDDTKYSDEAGLTADLEQALTNGQVSIAFQPIVDLAAMTVAGLEVLARWNHPQRGDIPPARFVRLAEQKGLIDRLTFLVLEKALAQQKSWREAGTTISLSVNLSVRSFLDPSLPARLQEALGRHQTVPGLLKLEITESMTISDPGRAFESLGRLHDMGIKISIDDFGSGYSALSYLKRFPLHEIKIDQSFIQDLLRNKESRVIVESTIGMAHLLGIEVVAEGIEDGETVELLRILGCERGQGYYFARPMSAEPMAAWLSAQARQTREPALP